MQSATPAQMANNESSTSSAGEISSPMNDYRSHLPSDLICCCFDPPQPSQVQCPLCRAPAVWCSIKCAEAHLRACAIARADVAQSIRLAFQRTPEQTQPSVTCCVCGSHDFTPGWIRCGICYHMKWCSMACYSNSSHYMECFGSCRDMLETTILHAEPISDQRLLKAIDPFDSYLRSAHDACPLCGQTTWAWTPSGGAKSQRRATIPSLIVHVQVLADTVKNDLLRFALHQMNMRQKTSKRLLSRLKRLDPLVANHFRLKSKPASNFVLRFANPIFSIAAMSELTGTAAQDQFDWPLGLLRSSGHVAHAAARCMAKATSFIAVSYCWHQSSWPVVDALTDVGSPLTIEMWKKIVQLRQSEEEGIWLDQLCINQDDKYEKQEAISAMDLIYHSARLVVVVLEDICVHAADIELLGRVFDLAGGDDRSKATEVATQFFVVFQKILTARWFSRAWCMHEHLCSTDTMLLIPVQDLQHAIAEVSFQRLLTVNDWIIFLSPTINTDKNFLALRTMTKQLMEINTRYESLVDIAESEKGGKIINYSEILARCLAMNASIETDKVSIALNISKLGLALNTSALSLDDCCYAFSLLAFAAGDWSCLCNRGSFLTSEIILASRFSDVQNMGNVSSWLQRPTLKETLIDIPIPRGDPRLTQSLVEASFSRLHFPMKLLSGDWTWRAPEGRFLEASQEFIKSDVCSSIFSTVSKEIIAPSSLDTLKMCLACALECGAAWIQHLFEEIVCKHPKLFPLQFKGFQDPDSKSKIPHFALGLGKTAASVLFPSASSSKHSDVALSLVWLILFLYYSNKPYMWILASKGREFQSLCDHAPTAVANMKIGIPSIFAGAEFTLFDRVWVGTVDQAGCFIPRLKLRGIGFKDFQESSLPCFQEVKRLAVQGPHAKADDGDTTLLDSVRAKLEAAGLSDEAVADALNPDRKYGKTSHIAAMDLTFTF